MCMAARARHGGSPLPEVAGVTEAALPRKVAAAEGLTVLGPVGAAAAGELPLPGLACLGAPLQDAVRAGVALAHQGVETVLAGAPALGERGHGLRDLLLLHQVLRVRNEEEARHTEQHLGRHRSCSLSFKNEHTRKSGSGEQTALSSR